MRLFALTVIASALMACSSTTPPDPARACDYRLRDLTVNWYERSYWCVPDGIPNAASRGQDAGK